MLDGIDTGEYLHLSQRAHFFPLEPWLRRHAPPHEKKKASPSVKVEYSLEILPHLGFRSVEKVPSDRRRHESDRVAERDHP